MIAFTPMRRLEVEQFIPHPIERVFARYTDHVGWSEWAGTGRWSLVREGSPDKNGVGCVRALSTYPGLREEVVRYEAPTRMDYRIVKGLIPLTDHLGEVRFAPEGSGTRVTWRVSFRPTVPGLGWLLERGLSRVFARMLIDLSKDLDRRC